MARHGGWVQLEQSIMRLVEHTATMAGGGYSHADTEETQCLHEKPHAKAREEKKWGVEFPRHGKVKAAMEIHPAMLRQNHMDMCLPCHNGTAKNPQISWRHKGMSAPSPNSRREPAPGSTPLLAGMPPAP